MSKRTKYDSLSHRIKNRRHQQYQGDLHEMLRLLARADYYRKNGKVDCRKSCITAYKMFVSIRTNHKLVARKNGKQVNHRETEYIALSLAIHALLLALGLSMYNFPFDDGRPKIYVVTDDGSTLGHLDLVTNADGLNEVLVTHKIIPYYF